MAKPRNSAVRKDLGVYEPGRKKEVLEADAVSDLTNPERSAIIL